MKAGMEEISFAGSIRIDLCTGSGPIGSHWLVTRQCFDFMFIGREHLYTPISHDCADDDVGSEVATQCY